MPVRRTLIAVVGGFVGTCFMYMLGASLLAAALTGTLLGAIAGWAEDQ